MTREHIYKEMTWAEVSDALAYVTQYGDAERFFGKTQKHKLNDWLYRGRNNLEADLRKAISQMRG